MDLNAHNVISTGSQSRQTIMSAIVCFAVAAGLLIFSLSHAGAATFPPAAITAPGSP